MFAAVKIKNYVPFLFSVLFLIMLLCFPNACAAGAVQGLCNAAEILIPSLFPYMVLSSFIMHSGADRYIGKIFSPVTKTLFNLPSVCSSAIILSLIGGFPVGTKCVQLLYRNKKITSEQAQRMMMFCVCSGPAFLITAIGAVMLHNTQVGVILYISQALSCIILGICTGIFSRIRKKTFQNTVHNEKNIDDSPSVISAVIEAASDGAASIISMTALVVIFSLLLNTLTDSGILGMLISFMQGCGISVQVSKVIVPVLLEVTTACTEVKAAALPVWWFSAAVGFGGICVHMQIFELLRNIPIKRGIYMLFRTVNAVLSTLIAFLIFQIYSPSTNVFSVFGGNEAEVSASTLAGSIALVIMCAVFLLTMKKKELSRHFLNF